MKNSGKRNVSIFLVLAVLLGCAAPALAAEYVFVLRNTSVYTAAGGKGGTLGKLQAGDSVEKNGVDGEWTCIFYNGKTGYIQSKDIVGHAEKEEARAVKAIKGGNVRSGPGTEYQKLGSIKKGGTVAYLKTEGEWAQIEYNGSTAYTLASFLDLSGVTASVSGGASSTVKLGKGDMELKLTVSKTVLKKGEAMGKGFGEATFTYKGSKKNVTLYGGEILCSIQRNDLIYGGLSKLDILDYKFKRNQSLSADLPPTSGIVSYENDPKTEFFKQDANTGALILAPGQYKVVASITYDTNSKFTAPVTLKVEIPITVLAA